MMNSRRNSFLNDIKEEQSTELNANNNLDLEFQDSDDDGSISLGFSDAMVGDEELRLKPTVTPHDPAVSGSVGSLVDDETGHDEFEGNVTQSKEKSIVEKIGKRTSVASLVTLVLLLCLGLGTVLGSFFIPRHEDCQHKRDEYDVLSRTLMQSVLAGIQEKGPTLRILANTVASNQWPYHVVDDFTQLSKDVRDAGVFSTVYLAPLVGEEVAWDQYVDGKQVVTSGTAKDESHVTSLTSSNFQLFESLPIWQMAPSMNADLINFDLLDLTAIKDAVKAVEKGDLLVYVGILPSELLLDEKPSKAFTLQPFSKKIGAQEPVGGYLIAEMLWEDLFGDLLPPRTKPLNVQLYKQSDRDTALTTILVDGPKATLLSETVEETKGNCHEVVCSPMSDGLNFCIFPAYEDTYPDPPSLYVGITAAVVVCAGCICFVYVCVVLSAQRQLADSANKSLALVSSLFPKDYKDRLLQRENSKDIDTPEQCQYDNNESSASVRSIFNKSGLKRGLARTKSSLTNFLYEPSEAGEQGGMDYFLKTKPIADLFPETTIMFADLVGFTAWSSAREPTSVFRLLETIYYHFDQLAKRRQVFKVETVGDCYVAVCGLPQPRKDHPVVMCRFARDCLLTFQRLVKELEVELGPDTGDLALRVGLHSGQTTAGILRGDRSRFQLFGDTVNVCSRIESTGRAGKVHLSQQTAALLEQAGKSHWITAREEEVVAKGKGNLATFWLEIYSTGSSGTGGMYSESEYTEAAEGSGFPFQEVGGDLQRTFSQQIFRPTETHLTEAERHTRLVEWNTDLLAKLLKGIVARRKAERKNGFDDWSEIKKLEDKYKEREALAMEEVVEVIEMPSYAQGAGTLGNIQLPAIVIHQLRAFVDTISYMYRDNPFHNFEHASHVCMSVNKLLSRIVAPDIQINGTTDLEHKLHDHTYGITSDPLTQFSCVLCALIHDVDHTGLPNAVLVAEETPLAKTYNNRSVAEQNSIDLAWDTLMEPQYVELRKMIYQTKDEFERFRKLLVNAVLATDIMDKDLKALRNSRWEKTFADKSQVSDCMEDDNNRKATIVIEHIIQASDVAHTMQHWQIYRKWNEKLYEELYNAYSEGRMETDPTENWYKGEIGFLDFYVIPLAKKLKECGVFGVSSDEYLSYALQNKEEWINKGEAIIAEMRLKMDNARNRQGKSLKTMSLLGSIDFGKQGNTSFSSFASVTDGAYPASPTKSLSKNSLQVGLPNRRNSTGPFDTGKSGNLLATSNRRNSTGSGRQIQQLDNRHRSRPSLQK